MGKYVSRLFCPCFGRDEKQNLETDYITPKTIQSDIESDTSNVDYICDNLFKEHGVTSYDNSEYGTRIRYYVLNNGKRIDMI